MPCTCWFVKTVAQSWFKLTPAKQSRVEAGTLLLPQSGEFWTHLMSQMNWKMQTDGRRQSEASPSSFPSDHWIQANNFVYFILNLQVNLVFLRRREHRTGAWSKCRAGSYWPVSSFSLLCNTMSLAMTHLALFFFFFLLLIHSLGLSLGYFSLVIWIKHRSPASLLFARHSSAAFRPQDWCIQTEYTLLICFCSF